jgi:hypothetical protein
MFGWLNLRPISGILVQPVEQRFEPRRSGSFGLIRVQPATHSFSLRNGVSLVGSGFRLRNSVSGLGSGFRVWAADFERQTAFRSRSVRLGSGYQVTGAKQCYWVANAVLEWRTGDSGGPGLGGRDCERHPPPTYLDTVPLASDKYSISRELPRRRTTGLDGKLGEARSG